MAETKDRPKITYARINGFPVEAAVQVNTPNEHRYHGKRGVVREHHLGEIGVDFGGTRVWFLPPQLVRV